jgi:hypothetical protein
MDLQEPAVPERESPTTDGSALGTLAGSRVPAETEAVGPRVSGHPPGVFRV